MQPIIFFLCTPRCGTQWIVKNLAENYSDEAIVLHEPIENEYHLKINLGRYESPLKLKNNSKFAEHLNFIDQITKDKIYIEVGWQSIAGIPALHQRFGNRLKLIHLYRNPVYVAASLVTHNWYTGKVKDRFEKSELNPFDEGSTLDEYKDRWSNLNLFEKSLYYWTEINLSALNIKYRYNQISFFSLKFEDLFERDKEISKIHLIKALSFMGLKYNSQLLEAIDIHHDHYYYKNPKIIDWRDIYNHPQTIALENELGYKFNNEINLNRYRYKKSILTLLINSIKKILFI